jgi:N-acyl amino acid synthase of PEP-CTERM/exosortase system
MLLSSFFNASGADVRNGTETSVHSVAEIAREETLLDRFNRYFKAVGAETPEEIRKAQRIRYQVYCTENGYENPEDFPDGLENDVFDAHSAHSLLMHRGKTVGTVRLILPRQDAPHESFALQRFLKPRALEAMNLPAAATAEVSRFCVSKDQLDRAARETQGQNIPPFDPRHAPWIRLGLFQAMFRMSAQHRISHWCALMEPQLLRLLAAMAIHFRPIGALVEHHGWRQPCYADVREVLRCVQRERPSYWDVLTDGGKIWNAPRLAMTA